VDTSWIIEYSRLSGGTYTDTGSYKELFCYCSHTWTVQLIRGVDLEIPICCFKTIGAMYHVFAVFKAEEADRVWDKGSKDATMVDVVCQSWRPFWIGPWNLPVSLTKLLVGKNKTSSFGMTLKRMIIRISELLDVWLKEFHCTSYKNILHVPDVGIVIRVWAWQVGVWVRAGAKGFFFFKTSRLALGQGSWGMMLTTHLHTSCPKNTLTN